MSAGACSRQVIIAGRRRRRTDRGAGLCRGAAIPCSLRTRRRASRRPAPACSFRPTRRGARELGVLDGCCRAGGPARGGDAARARSLAVLARVPLGDAAEQRWGAPYLVAHRADLQGALDRHGLAANPTSSSSRREVRDFALHARRRHRLDRPDGGQPSHGPAAGSPPTASGRAARRFGARTAKPFSGSTAWRATGGDSRPVNVRRARRERLRHRLPASRLPPGGLSDPRAATAFNLVAFTDGAPMAKTGPASGRMPSWRAPWPGRAGACARWSRRRNLDGLAGSHVDRDAPWTVGGGIALIGDAAHAMTPFAAQGAAMAIEDAVTLADSRGRGRRPSMRRALAAWETGRRRACAAVLRRGCAQPPRLACRRAGCAGPQPVPEGAVPERLAADLDWLYGWEPPRGQLRQSQRTAVFRQLATAPPQFCRSLSLQSQKARTESSRLSGSPAELLSAGSG